MRMLDFSELCLYLSLPYCEGFFIFYNLIALTKKIRRILWKNL